MSQPNIEHNFHNEWEESKEEAKLIPQQTLRRININNSEQVKDVLERWIEVNSDNPYPKYRDRVELCK